MKIETLLLAHAVLSGAGIAGSAVAITYTGVELLYIPLSVCLFFLASDIRKIQRRGKRKSFVIHD